MKTRWIPLVVLLMLIVAGCSQSQEAGPLEPLAPPKEIYSTRLATSPSQVDSSEIELSTPLPDNVQMLIEKAKVDLAQKLSISASEINLVTALQVTWPDSSLGCPQPGIMYIQVETKGFIVTLDVSGIRYTYSTDAGHRVVACERLQLPVFPVTPGEIDDGEPWMPVD